MGLGSAAAADCPVGIGEVVNLETPQSVYDRLSPMQIIKDEFETTSTYNQRKEKLLAKTKPFIVLADNFLDNRTMVYDADNQRFMINENAFDYFFNVPNAAFVPSGIGPKGLSYREVLLASYLSTELSGELTESKYWLLDRYQSYLTSKNVWQYDIHNYHGDLFGPDTTVPVFLLDVPIDQARQIKDEMKVAVYGVPKTPVTFTNQPGKAIIADMKCVLFLDGQNRLLKTVRSKLHRTPMDKPIPGDYNTGGGF